MKNWILVFSRRMGEVIISLKRGTIFGVGGQAPLPVERQGEGTRAAAADTCVKGSKPETRGIEGNDLFISNSVILCHF